MGDEEQPVTVKMEVEDGNAGAGGEQGGSSSGAGGATGTGGGAGYSNAQATDPTSGSGPSAFMQQISSTKQGSTSPSGGGITGISGSENEAKLTVNLTSSERDAIIKQNSFRTALDVARKLNDIKNERKGLRT